jgi:hypothetical protein
MPKARGQYRFQPPVVDCGMPTKAKKKKTNRKKTAAKTTKSAKKTVKKKVAKSGSRPPKKQPRKKPVFVGLEALEPKTTRRAPGGLAGDLQGVSTTESADSESVAELLEEGNVVEAEAVAGVEAADVDNREVQTHEVLEDDVPDEYRNKD